MTITILHLGAGIQSSSIYCLMVDGEIPPCDYAVFSDTQEEPSWVYKQLNYCREQNGPPIVEVTAGKIGDDLVRGRAGAGRFASIPAFTAFREGRNGGMTRRQCTREYKVEPIERWIRRDLLGLQKRQRIPAGVRLVSLFGFSTDESKRAVGMQQQFAKHGERWRCDFPLIADSILMTRQDAKVYIERRSGFDWQSSRCVFCPMQRNVHWREIKKDPEAWGRAVEVDNALRATGTAANRNMKERMYVHRSCVPLDRANLDEGQGELFGESDGCNEGCFL